MGSQREPGNPVPKARSNTAECGGYNSVCNSNEQAQARSDGPNINLRGPVGGASPANGMPYIAEELQRSSNTDDTAPRPPPPRPPLRSSSFHRRRRYSYDEEDETNTLNTSESSDETPVSWCSLPKKGQLAVLTIARLSEPLAQTSLQAYVFHQVRSFDPSLSDATVSAQAGVLQACFTAAQFVTGVLWGRLADTAIFGRKGVLLIGLFGAAMASTGFGFSRSLTAAITFRTLGGALNSNVGVMRTMIAEIIEGKKYQSRAFLILPMCFNVGIIIGPILGGILADPIKTYPGIFGPGTLLGGKEGIWWMEKWPYALPNLVSAMFMFIALVAVFLGLDEVSVDNP
ncbi:hypothetical protein LOZ12_005024 [Ophidiomyces ophidiicola]|uniref:Uncharacterized protein n=2 Tax=Ophidiomyces ophidiicola TaxID=1387563 RepID=A0ACB8USU0_9EURO|nr:hypothetical protein LOZ64_004147 [Ophidiomyces ophidiicola]KAI1916745.1 hypothetical protein LOZ61_001015 [Ophidiomyces ophidiicola]KAI1922585.1 hypothetical protein LOZ60_005598 [Ophidiomyces ophidiicola]KAI1938278.1 hypothetical protein LOZ62_005305 [Ophidiomyces ophidiicola]KAI1953383.1 hypothetical protein LOZ59_005100 [Ophidiomyces ophidiicola]